MRINDHVDFTSDLQTEKGPSAGFITNVDTKQVTIKHSDHPGEVFDIETLIVLKKTSYKGSQEILWILR